MAKRLIKAGSTDQTIDIFIQDSTSTTGAGKTGLAFNTASLVCYYRKNATGSATQLTLATQTVGGAHSDGGFVEIDATNMPGMYRLDLSDTMVATGPYVTIMLKGATGMAPVTIELQLVAFDPADGVRLGLTALPNAAAEAAGGLYTRGTGAGQIEQPANGQVNVNVHRWLTGTPNALQSGRVDSYIGAIASGVIAAGSFAAGAFDAVWTVATRTLTAFDSSFKTGYALSAAGVQAIWDALTSALTTVGSIGKLLVDNINATISSRASQASLDTLDDYVDTEVAAIKAKTDSLTFTVGGVVDANTLRLGGTVQTAADLGALIQTLTAAERNAIADAIFARSLGTEAVSADGAVPTFAQAMFEILSGLFEFAIAGTTITCKKRDGSTTLFTSTLDSSTTPTSRTRAT